MLSVTILRTLWRRRALVGLVAVIAVAVGWFMAFKPSFPPQQRGSTVGVASAALLVDTPKSQVLDINPKGYDTLASRANVLANVMVDGEIKNAIATLAGVPSAKLIATSQSLGNDSPIPKLTTRSYALRTSVALTSDMSLMPIVIVRTQAPTLGEAIRLANAAVSGLSRNLDSQAITEAIPVNRRLRVRALGTAQGQNVAQGPGRITPIILALVVFFAGCALILFVSAVRRDWRAAVANDRELASVAPSPALEDEEVEVEQDEEPSWHKSPAELRAG